MMRLNSWFIFLAMLLMTLPGQLSAQELTPDEAFVWSIEGPSETLKPGDTAEIVLTLTIAPKTLCLPGSGVSQC